MLEGRSEPTDLYTVDLHLDNLIKRVGVNREMQMSKKKKKYKKMKDNLIRKKLFEDI